MGSGSNFYHMLGVVKLWFKIIIIHILAARWYLQLQGDICEGDTCKVIFARWYLQGDICTESSSLRTQNESI